MTKKQTTASVIAICLIAVGAYYMILTNSHRHSAAALSSADQAAVTQTVTDFGQKLQLVSLLAPASDVKESMDANYAPYVAPQLLSSWENDPANAPGRTVSSPWPDRIEISNVTANTDGSYTVTGTVIEVTSTEMKNGTAFDTYPITMTLQKMNSAWLISSFSKGLTTITPVSH